MSELNHDEREKVAKKAFIEHLKTIEGIDEIRGEFLENLVESFAEIYNYLETFSKYNTGLRYNEPTLKTYAEHIAKIDGVPLNKDDIVNYARSDMKNHPGDIFLGNIIKDLKKINIEDITNSYKNSELDLSLSMDSGELILSGKIKEGNPQSKEEKKLMIARVLLKHLYTTNNKLYMAPYNEDVLDVTADRIACKMYGLKPMHPYAVVGEEMERGMGFEHMLYDLVDGNFQNYNYYRLNNSFNDKKEAERHAIEEFESRITFLTSASFEEKDAIKLLVDMKELYDLVSDESQVLMHGLLDVIENACKDREYDFEKAKEEADEIIKENQQKEIQQQTTQTRKSS